MRRPVTLVVNGASHDVLAEPRRLLVDVLRHDIGCYGVHIGCELGACGACTVLMNGQPVLSCLTLAVQADGASITTVEGLASGDELSEVQRGFKLEHGLQCGFCTPGLLVAATDLLARIPEPTEEQIRRELSGNLCRCTGYTNIVKSVERASRLRAEMSRPAS